MRQESPLSYNSPIDSFGAQGAYGMRKKPVDAGDFAFSTISKVGRYL